MAKVPLPLSHASFPVFVAAQVRCLLTREATDKVKINDNGIELQTQD